MRDPLKFTPFPPPRTWQNVLPCFHTRNLAEETGKGCSLRGVSLCNDVLAHLGVMIHAPGMVSSGPCFVKPHDSIMALPRRKENITWVSSLPLQLRAVESSWGWTLVSGWPEYASEQSSGSGRVAVVGWLMFHVCSLFFLFLVRTWKNAGSTSANFR